MKSRRTLRTEIIQTIYKYELLNLERNINNVFEQEDLSHEQIKQIEIIFKNYDFYQKVIISQYKEGWTWNRINPLIKAILLNATNEFFFLAPRIVVNEAVEITKTFFGDDQDSSDYKIINAVLQKIYQYFVKSEILVKHNDQK